eukprot:365754-Chlamydomonas_euryale.AAC.5
MQAAWAASSVWLHWMHGSFCCMLRVPHWPCGCMCCKGSTAASAGCVPHERPACHISHINTHRGGLRWYSP